MASEKLRSPARSRGFYGMAVHWVWPVSSSSSELVAASSAAVGVRGAPAAVEEVEEEAHDAY